MGLLLKQPLWLCLQLLDRADLFFRYSCSAFSTQPLSNVHGWRWRAEQDTGWFRIELRAACRCRDTSSGQLAENTYPIICICPLALTPKLPRNHWFLAALRTN